MDVSPRQKAAKGGPRKDRSERNLFAAIDLGTNNCRLLIAEPRGNSFRVVDAYSRIVRLGEGLHATGQLSEAAMERAHAALGICSQKLKRLGVRRVRAIATQACRIATNGEAFLKDVEKLSGIRFRAIAPREEARLAVIGCLNLIEPEAEHVLVVDIGGGSTELSWVDAGRATRQSFGEALARPAITDWASFPFGVVTLAERFPECEGEGYEATVSFVERELKDHPAFETARTYFETGRGHLIGTSGTVTSLAGIHLNLERYARDKVDGTWLHHDEALAAIGRLRATDRDGRAKEPCIGTERADLVLAGCAILEAIWRLSPSTRMRVADRGLREGVLLSLMYSPAKRKRRGKSKRRRKGGGQGGPSAKAANPSTPSNPNSGPDQ
jgi:exopolyphosphatase / guanosine-5'-triphosphate,3'-diphosphate pyrophosphatase